MFDHVFEMAGHCADSFQRSVKDAFGASIVTDVLDPICNEIGLLRASHEEFQRQSLNIDQVLREARSFHLNEVPD